MNRVQGIASSRALGIGLPVNSQIAVGVLLNPLERLFDFVNRVLVGGQQAQRKIAVEIVRAGIRHVQAVAGHFLGGFLGQAVHLAEQLFAQIEQAVVKLLPLGLDLHFAVLLRLLRTTGRPRMAAAVADAVRLVPRRRFYDLSSSLSQLQPDSVQFLPIFMSQTEYTASR